MKKDHARLRDLILCHEDLGGPELARAEAHLAACAECRDLLARLRTIERSEPPRGMLPPLATGHGAQPLAPRIRAEADLSLRMLRAKLGLSEWRPAAFPGVGQTVRRRRRFRRPGPAARVMVPVALAAGVVLAVFVSRTGREQEVVLGLRVAPFSIDRGGPDTTVSSLDLSWRTGDTFVLAFDLSQAAHPVVFHVGPEGEIDLIHPADASVPVPLMPAGRGLRLPLPGGQEYWALDDSPGTESFLIAAAGSSDPALADIVAEARAIVRGTTSRHERIRALDRLLTERLGPVQTVHLEHRR